MSETERTISVMVRLSPAEYDHLQELVRLSERKQPDVLRVIIRRATVDDVLPSVALRGREQPVQQVANG